MKKVYADIVLPISVSGIYTYIVPEYLSGILKRGSRVIVPFGSRKIYTGLVVKIHNDDPVGFHPREISGVLKSAVIINDRLIDFLLWMAEYYLSFPGEVINAAIPARLLPEGMTRLMICDIQNADLNEGEDWIIELLKTKRTVTVDSLPKSVGGAATLDVVASLLARGVISSVNEVSEEKHADEYNALLMTDACWEDFREKGVEMFGRAMRQYEIAEVYVRLVEGMNSGIPLPVNRSRLKSLSGINASVISTMISRGYFIPVRDDEAQQGSYNTIPLVVLDTFQKKAFDSINTLFNDQEVVLLHGVTSSGKTEIYIHLIEQELRRGRQVLYLLPEIALTTQIIERLRRHFGSATGIYHSRLSLRNRYDIWQRAGNNDSAGRLNLILGVRSSLFLPFEDLGLVIVDEEHDSSYKQYDPAPRYQARDAAIMLARIHGARTLLGSATPSVESYYNATAGKYGLVEMTNRYGNVLMPEMIVADTRAAYKKMKGKSLFTQAMLKEMEEALGRDEQIILFQNRRGFSHYIICSECGWVPGCVNCSVSYTYHKSSGNMICHYCGKSIKPPKQCPECGSSYLLTKGFGTEKIEEEVKLLFPSARVARLDQDTARIKNSYSSILEDFAEGLTDILIGTQMISKGLDFESLTVVGILDADSMLHFPDFRAHERSFQMMEQVSGRAGRRTRRGKVIIQTADPAHFVLRRVLKHDYKGMFEEQISERELFAYPPFSRLIKITLKHHDREKANTAAVILAETLRKHLGKCVLGPESPLIDRMHSWYLKTILLKLGRDISASKVKEMLRLAMNNVQKSQGMGGVRIYADIDPQ